MDLLKSPHPATLDDDQLFRLCVERRDRASGPGGQHRNKVETRITLVHKPTGVTGSAGERRSQDVNRTKALQRLRLSLAVQVRTERNSPSALWLSRVHKKKIACNPKHTDYPAMLAEALDQLSAHGWQPSEAAKTLQCSSSQLLKLIKNHPPAWQLINTQRTQSGKRPLK